VCYTFKGHDISMSPSMFLIRIYQESGVREIDHAITRTPKSFPWVHHIRSIILRPIETGQGEGVEVRLSGGQGEKL